MVVYAEIDLPLKALGEQFLRGHVYGHIIRRREIRRGKEFLRVGAELFYDLAVGIQIRRLSKAAQSAAQGGGAADGVPVRVLMAYKQYLVLL